MKRLVCAMKLTGLKILLLFLTIAMTLKSGYAQNFEFSNDRKKDAINMILIKNLVIIPVYINNKGPFNFILDTGVGPMIISDPSLTDSLNIKDLRTIKISGLGKGGEIEAYVTTSLEARIGKATLEHIPTAVLKEDLFRLSSYVGMPINGLLGYHFFKSFIVELKYSNKRVVFYLPSYGKKIKGERIALEMINDKPYAKIEIESPELGALTLNMLVDNGASHAISLEILDKKPFPLPPVSILANLGMGLGGPISGSIGRVPIVRIGSFQLQEVLSSYPKYEDVAGKVLLHDRNGNLGADILSRFDVTFDYADNAMYLRKNGNFNRPFQHDMAGMEIYSDDTQLKRYYIGRIEPDSPAETGGLEAEDEIIFLNFLPASSYSLTEINKVFREGNDRTVVVTILRKGLLNIKVIKLKQRI
ncbi:peptide-binding protein [Pedobacter sp. PACM 27299]|uniref:aspartyl protease family protein n=1 Tax=Pedobacter sp. PACM 27299 TaxID=1727164 RepID=UPI000706D9B8|nr:aspartyl protease family protein [Pedobacter sp. PACM 27299]ALL04101.1 peptide-binding protein [Pedobacter sp. PACM 27299]